MKESISGEESKGRAAKEGNKKDQKGTRGGTKEGSRTYITYIPWHILAARC